MLKAVNINEGTTSHSINIKFPEECHYCHTNIEPEFLNGAIVKGDAQRLFMESIFQCKNPSCNSLIIAYYQRRNIKVPFKLVISAPIHIGDKIVNSEIMNISPNFVKTYNQLLWAEHNGLNLILGIGYRTALEMLVKDYLLYLEPNNKEIWNGSLYSSINKIENQNIKNLPKKVTWISNKELNYARNWSKKDIDDLKRMIDVIATYITMDIRLKNQIR